MLQHQRSQLRKTSKINIVGFSGKYILYLLPPPLLSEQIDYFWRSMPYSEAAMYVPHVSLTGFFSASNKEIDDLISELNTFIQDSSFDVEVLQPEIKSGAVWLEIKTFLSDITLFMMRFGKKRNLLIRIKDGNHFSLAYRDKKVHSGDGPLSYNECCEYYDRAKRIPWDASGLWRLALVACTPSQAYRKPHELSIIKSWPIC